jgi:hypothetical protein
MNDTILRYFMDGSGFSRVMEGMWDLYVRYRRCFGAVRLHRPTPEEEKVLSTFFKRLLRPGVNSYQPRGFRKAA